jgi:hypothetical protein
MQQFNHLSVFVRSAFDTFTQQLYMDFDGSIPAGSLVILSPTLAVRRPPIVLL